MVRIPSIVTRRRLAVAAVLVFLVGGCAHRDREVLSTGWAWPLPPPSQRSPEFAARARAAADLARLRKTMPWAGEILSGRGSATAPRDVDDLSIVPLLKRVQAREAARRQLADRIAALPMPVASGQRGPAPHLGDPGRLTPEQASGISDLIAQAPIRSEQEATGGRHEVEVALPLANVARMVLGEPVIEEEPTPSAPRPATASGASDTSATIAETVPAPEAAPPETSAPAASGPASRKPGLPAPGFSSSSRRIRAGLPPVSDQEFAAAAAFDASQQSKDSAVPEWDWLSPSPEAKVEAQRRADSLARRWLWDEVRVRPLSTGSTLAQATAVLPSVRRLVQARIDTAPVRSITWDSLGRCRATIALDWKALERDVKPAKSGSGLSPSSEPLSLP